jgi:hypothetical protein
MSEERRRTEIVSLRLTPEERAALEQQAGDRALSAYLRHRALGAPPVLGLNPHMQTWSGTAWRLEAAPGRVIQVRRQPNYYSDGVAVWTSADARKLAAALLQAADLAEQPDPMEEAS